ncbi:MAG: hypothetical protein IJH37_03190 [Clostridia bacterium]|nr:hypothetical protein [Clostridia bacterium]
MPHVLDEFSALFDGLHSWDAKASSEAKRNDQPGCMASSEAKRNDQPGSMASSETISSLSSDTGF